MQISDFSKVSEYQLLYGIPNCTSREYQEIILNEILSILFNLVLKSTSNTLYLFALFTLLKFHTYIIIFD